MFHIYIIIILEHAFFYKLGTFVLNKTFLFLLKLNNVKGVFVVIIL